jgi:hypothetical protein
MMCILWPFGVPAEYTSIISLSSNKDGKETQFPDYAEVCESLLTIAKLLRIASA